MQYGCETRVNLPEQSGEQMQIHEITTKIKIPKLNEGVMDTILGILKTDPAMAGLSADQKGAMVSQNSKIKELADEAFSKWQIFAAGIESRITDPAEKTAFKNRTDGEYKKNLMAA